MGSIHFRRIELVTSLNELVGYKAGLSLDRPRMKKMLTDDAAVLNGSNDDLVRVRSEAYEQMLCKLLFGVGNISSPDPMPSHIRLYHAVKEDQELYPVYLSVTKKWVEFCGKEMAKCLKNNTKTIDPRPLLIWAEKKHGMDGTVIALALLEGQNEDMHKGAFGHFRRNEWKDVTELNQLFESEGLKTKHGEFFDQRFIDFLSKDYDSIGKINWRKFEALTCEFFHRSGFKVEIGKGRNDDSIDARIWKTTQNPESDPPLILVQCKRQKDSVEKVVVKALYADVLHHRAESGLIVTSSALSPGAKKLCLSRSYPVSEANRETLRQWVNAMKTPLTGIFMGE